jgi:hypothetical protein
LTVADAEYSGDVRFHDALHVCTSKCSSSTKHRRCASMPTDPALSLPVTCRASRRYARLLRAPCPHSRLHPPRL